MNATVSSIHVNGWFGAHSKLSGARWIVRRLLGRDLDAERDDWLYVGDSTNDELMFATFPLSVGVANIADFADRLQQWPAYVTALDRGRGFVEVAEALARRARRMSGTRPLPTLVVAAALALGSAVSLGLARFAYALLLPAMRADLGWSYFTAGAMNTVNAAGYLAGALLAPPCLAPLRRAHGAGRGDCGDRARPGRRTARSRAMRRCMRCAFSAARRARLRSSRGAVLAAGSVARRRAAQGRRVVRPHARALLRRHRHRHRRRRAARAGPRRRRGASHAWQPAWIGLGAIALAASALLALATRRRDEPVAAAAGSSGAQRFRWRPFAPGLVAYLLFGLGYIGYMTFVITLLREQQLAPVVITVVLRDARPGGDRLLVALGRACCSAFAAASRSRS